MKVKFQLLFFYSFIALLVSGWLAFYGHYQLLYFSSLYCSFFLFLKLKKKHAFKIDFYLWILLRLTLLLKAFFIYQDSGLSTTVGFLIFLVLFSFDRKAKSFVPFLFFFLPLAGVFDLLILSPVAVFLLDGSIFRQQEFSDEMILFFDGHCNLCNGFVDFLTEFDLEKAFIRFAPLQGSKARSFGLDNKKLDSVVIFENDKKYTRYKGVLRVLRRLNGPWLFFYFLGKCIPVAVGNIFYQIVAKNRYRLFGKSQHCRVPSEGEKKLFYS